MNPTARVDEAPRAILLMGPTASGKTACALHLARTLSAEVISVDSALVYREMDVGTAKPNAEELSQCPHHLIDIISPEESYSAARFREDALSLIHEVWARGRVPILAGGTMLYFKALREGLSELPQANPAIRAEIEQRAARFGWPALHEELAARDPEAAARLNPNDSQRIQRALEISLLTGQPVSESFRSRSDSGGPAVQYLSLALKPSDRGRLHARIAERFETMLSSGLVDEVRRLRQRYQLSADMTSVRCVGYRQTWEYLDGDITLDELRFKGVAATRQLAKRQLTWMRQFAENWADFEELDCLDPALNRKALDVALRWLDEPSGRSASDT